VCRFHVAAGAKQSLDEAPYKFFGAVMKLASITFSSLAFSYWTNKPWFLTEGNLLLCSSYLPLGVPNWTVIYINTVPQQATIFWRRCWGKRRLLQEEFRMHILYFVLSFALLYFCFNRFYQKHKKISFLLVIFTCLLLALLEWVLMRTPSCVILLALIIVILSILLLRHLFLLQIFMRLSLLY
jgi:hypothetical protein